MQPCECLEFQQAKAFSRSSRFEKGECIRGISSIRMITGPLKSSALNKFIQVSTIICNY